MPVDRGVPLNNALGGNAEYCAAQVERPGVANGPQLLNRDPGESQQRRRGSTQTRDIFGVRQVADFASPQAAT